MEKIVWDDKLFCVGNPILDEQHKKVIGMVNDLIDLSLTRSRQSDLVRVLANIANQSSYHFGIEEALLDNAQSHYLHEHAKYNELYMEKVADFIVSFAIENIDVVLVYLVDWWVDHILVENMKFKDAI